MKGAAKTMSAAGVDRSDLETVRQLEKLRLDATRRNDVDSLGPLLDDDLLYVNSVGEVYDKTGYLEAIRTRKLTYACDFDVHETDCRLADAFILLGGVAVGHARLDGEQQVFRFRSLSIWRKRLGTWRLYAWQASTAAGGRAWWGPMGMIAG